MQRTNTGDNFLLILGQIIIVFLNCEARKEALQASAGKFRCIDVPEFTFSLWRTPTLCFQTLYFIWNFSASCLITQASEEVWGWEKQTTNNNKKPNTPKKPKQNRKLPFLFISAQ